MIILDFPTWALRDRRARGNVTKEAETGITQSKNISGSQQPPKLGLSPSLQREGGLASTLILDLWASEL